MPFVDREQQEEEDDQDQDDDDDHEYTDIEEEDDQEDAKQPSSPFTIIGLNSMKLVIWNSMYDHVTDACIYEKDLCLVIFVSALLTDAAILSNMQSLKESLSAISSLNVRILFSYSSLLKKANNNTHRWTQLSWEIS